MKAVAAISDWAESDVGSAVALVKDELQEIDYEKIIAFGQDNNCTFQVDGGEEMIVIQFPNPLDENDQRAFLIVNDSIEDLDVAAEEFF